AIEESQVIPGVVMKKRAIRMSAFHFHVLKKIATQLRGMGHADDGGVRHTLSRLHREFTGEPAGGAISPDATVRQGMLEAQEPRTGSAGRSFHMAREG